MDGGRIGSLHTGNSYLHCFGGGLPPKDGMVVDGGSGLLGAIGWSAGLGCGCSIGCNFGLIIFFLVPFVPCPFLGNIGEIIL